MPDSTLASTTVSLNISDRFDVLGYPSGGYLAQLASQEIARHVQHPDLLAINASFVGHPACGAAAGEIVALSTTKSLSRATLALSQQSELKAFYVATFTDFSLSTGLTHSFSGDSSSFEPWEGCEDVRSLPLPRALKAFLSGFEVRLKPGCLADPGPDRGNRAEIEGWIKFLDGAAPTLDSLVLFADAFPPAIFNVVEPSQWGSVPTVEYSVHLKAKPAPGPIHAYFTSHRVDRGFLEIDGQLRDSQGVLVAESRQLAKFRGALSGLAAGAAN
ncbi:thioesterase family protein [Variovorax sp. OV700]|uniref:thioesterase family protein n=1 Tax=Variovorax sp. OV700 TaxID=1882826 RepID=UPI0008866EF5|nr:thioesterase family protein [Variovorax sp. OV700]SDH56462.1 Thioesterase-like superfamily protein [Variovorax sp. OV700]